MEKEVRNIARVRELGKWSPKAAQGSNLESVTV